MSYHLGVGQKGLSRRQVLNEITNPATAQFLVSHGLKKGMQVLDVGCGIGIMSTWIAEYVGKEGYVTGVDNSVEQLMIARELSEEEKIKNIAYLDVGAENIHTLEKQFDFVYCRYLLIHLKNPAVVIQKIFDVLKPGGIFFCQSAIMGNEFCYPESEAFNLWRQLRHDVYLKLNCDPLTGAKVYHLMYETGFKQIECQLFQPVLKTGRVRHEMVVNDLLEQDTILIQNNLITEEELIMLKEELIVLAEDPTYFVTHHQSAQVVGIKPQAN